MAALAAGFLFRSTVGGIRRTGIFMRAPAGDDDIAAAFSRKERWAFEEAYRRYGSLLFSTALRVVGDRDDAADCVHDALARVWRSPNAYSRSAGAIRSFLVVCVRNEAVTRARSKARRLKLDDRLAAEPSEHEELRTIDFLENDRLHRALANLPAEQRKPLELAYFEQKTHTEIARELDEPLGTVKSRIAMGLRKLGSALA